MKTFVRCGHLFTGQEDDARAGETLLFDEHGMLDYVGPEKGRRGGRAMTMCSTTPPIS